MSVVGVRLRCGRLAWVEANQHSLTPLSSVTVRTAKGLDQGMVVVTPDQLWRAVTTLDGQVVRGSDESTAKPVCHDLPHVDLPYLGQRVTLGERDGYIAALDVLQARARVEHEDGTSSETDVSEIT